MLTHNGEMGIADRHYHRNQPQGGGFTTQLTPVVKWLLIANAAVYLLDIFLGDKFGYKPLRHFGAFAIQSAIFEGGIWEFFTFQFLHGSVGHLVFNSIALFFFGPWMERWWGSRKFLIFYLLCGVAGAVFFTLLTFLNLLPGGMQSSMVGASAGIYGILIGVAVVAPNLRVMLLFPPIELSMRQLAIGLLVIASGSILLRIGGNEGGEAGHLGGAILGYFLVRHPHLLGWNPFAGRPEPRGTRPSAEPKLRPRSTLHRREDSEVDLILDKVSREGFQSLTQEERDILQRAAQRQNSDS